MPTTSNRCAGRTSSKVSPTPTPNRSATRSFRNTSSGAVGSRPSVSRAIPAAIGSAMSSVLRSTFTMASGWAVLRSGRKNASPPHRVETSAGNRSSTCSSDVEPRCRDSGCGRAEMMALIVGQLTRSISGVTDHHARDRHADQQHDEQCAPRTSADLAPRQARGQSPPTDLGHRRHRRVRPRARTVEIVDRPLVEHRHRAPTATLCRPSSADTVWSTMRPSRRNTTRSVQLANRGSWVTSTTAVP